MKNMRLQLFLIPFESALSFIQITLAEMIHNQKAMPIQQFDHSVEFQLIKVMVSAIPYI
jgi:hypothetical protein